MGILEVKILFLVDTECTKKFLIPHSNQIKASVAGSRWISVGDLKEGFNQIDNEPETNKKMAMMKIACVHNFPKKLCG